MEIQSSSSSPVRPHHTVTQLTPSITAGLLQHSEANTKLSNLIHTQLADNRLVLPHRVSGRASTTRTIKPTS